jgi:hypothetical protein
VMNELIEKICAQTGQPATTVAPIVGALLAHLGDVLPAPFAHQLAIILGIHPADGTTDANAAGPQSEMGGLLGGLAASFGNASGNTDPRFAGAGALINVAQSLLSGFLAEKR